MDNETNELGRVADGEQALVNEAATHLPPAGFDPSRYEPQRYEGKPRHLPKEEGALLQLLLDAVEEKVALLSDREQTQLLSACLNVSPINCGWNQYAIADIVYHSLSHDIAQGIPLREDSEAG